MALSSPHLGQIGSTGNRATRCSATRARQHSAARAAPGKPPLPTSRRFPMNWLGTSAERGNRRMKLITRVDRIYPRRLDSPLKEQRPTGATLPGVSAARSGQRRTIGEGSILPSVLAPSQAHSSSGLVGVTARAQTVQARNWKSDPGCDRVAEQRREAGSVERHGGSRGPGTCAGHKARFRLSSFGSRKTSVPSGREASARRAAH